MSGVFKTKAVRMFSYFNKHKAPQEEWAAKACERLGRLKKLAAELSLVLYHENESDIYGEHLDEVARIRDEFRDGKVFRMIFDFDNYNRGHDDVWQNWLALRDTTDAIHLKDSDKQGFHVPCGEGNGRVREILADAVARKWNGPLTLEPHLLHSKAVLATHVTGKQNKNFQDMNADECFDLAAVTAKKLLADVGAK
jgi:sugar phosphate isomerase/epimerase